MNVSQFSIQFFFALQIRYLASELIFLNQPLFPGGRRMKLHAVQVPSAQPQSVRNRKRFSQAIQKISGSTVQHEIAGDTSLKN